MSLVTRCTSCATLFRLEQDQLRASDGWVRCGRCHAVFDALESLDGLKPQEPTPLPPPEFAEGMSAVSDGPHAEPIDIESLLKRRVEAQIVQPATAAEGAASSDALLSALASPESSAEPMPAPASSATIEAPDPLPLARPEFVRRAERDARWRSPAMRGALSVISVVLLLLLGAQVAYHHRDELAARSPSAADLLDAACARFINCVIRAPRRLDAVAVAHSSLSRVPERPDALQLSLRIANRNPIVVAMPAVELSLTDAAGQLIARRALLPADFGVDAQASIDARTERPLQLLFSAGEFAVSGFSVELFHP